MQGFNFESDEGMVSNRKMNVFKISDPSVTQKQVSIQVYYKNESIYLISKQFEYSHSNGVFMKLHPDEEFPLSLGSVI